MIKKDDTRLRLKNKFVRNFIYSKLLFIGLMILAQMTFYVLLFVKLTEGGKYMAIASMALSVSFLIYLANSKGKNEFKMAWLVPVIIFPLFGIFLYLICHKNMGGLRLKRRISRVKEESADFMKNLPEEKITLEKNPKIGDIASYLKYCGNFPAYSENKTRYYPNGESWLPDMLAELKKAESFIFMEYFIIDEGEMWNDILDVLKERTASGVTVRLIFDGFGSLRLDSGSYINYLKKIGIDTKVFIPLIPFVDTAQNNRDHHKIMVIDGRIAYTGGINLTDEYVNLDHHRFNYWKDTNIAIEGSAVRTYTMLFLQTWHSISRFKQLDTDDFARWLNVDYPVFKKTGAVIPYADDAFNDVDLAENVYNYILDRAHTYVHIMTPYLILDNTMINNLIFAAQRGVDVSIILPGHYDHFVTYCVGHRFAKQLIENGVKIYFYQPGFIHAKVFVSDNARATVGSINLDYRSFYHHFECGVYLYRTDSIKKIEEDFEETRNQSKLITMEEFKKLSLFRRITGWIFKITAPLL